MIKLFRNIRKHFPSLEGIKGWVKHKKYICWSLQNYNTQPLSRGENSSTMIKFFRHIRHNLMETGKTSRYLKYAIGKIALVVIGILIAENLAPTLKSGFSKILKP